jgi:hypothetical protein
MTIALVTVITKAAGSLSKRIHLNGDGELVKDASQCALARGKAVMLEAGDAFTLASLIDSLTSNQALTLGQVKGAQPGETKIVVSKDEGPDGIGAVARSLDHFHFAPNVPAWALLDFDGLVDIAAIETVVPAVRHAAQVTRPSTSAGIVNVATGVPIANSSGGHVYIGVADGADIGRFLNVLGDRLWLAGRGHIALSSVGSMLERTLVDVAVASPERLVFEGPPTLGPGLRQERETVPCDGAFIDTRVVCPDLNGAEEAQIQALKAAAKAAIRPKAEAVQAAWIDARAPEIASKRGLPEAEIRRQLASSFAGDLEGAFPLCFDDPALGAVTVADVLQDSARFLNATLSDPMEPETQNGQCAILYKGSKDNRLFIKTFAHSGAYYFLKGETPAPGAARTGVVITPSSFRPCDPATFPRRQFLYGRHYMRKYLSTTIAPGDVGKTALVLVEAIAMATGRPLLKVLPKGLSKVWYWNGEDPLEEIERRVLAICKHYDVDHAELVDRLFLNSGREMKLTVAETGDRGFKIVVPVKEALTEAIRANAIDVLVLDPFAKTYRVNENDNSLMGAVADLFADVAETTNCAIELVHHARKTGGAEVTIEDARGASSVIAAARMARTLNRMTKFEGELIDVKTEDCRFHVRVNLGAKSNMAPPQKAVWVKLTDIGLGNFSQDEDEDHVQVVETWSWPDALIDLTIAHLREVQRQVSAKPRRRDIRSPDWVGFLIITALGLDRDSKAHREKAKAIFETWRKNKMFKIVTRSDAKSIDRDFVEVDEWASDHEPEDLS